MSDLAITVYDQEFKDGYLPGFDQGYKDKHLPVFNLSFHSALWGQLVFEDQNGVKLGLNFDKKMEERGGYGPLYFKISSAIERIRDWNLIHYGAPGIARETWITEVFVRLPLPSKSKAGGHIEPFLNGFHRNEIPVLVLKETEALQIAESLRTCYNPGIAVAHADETSKVSRLEDREEYRAWCEEYGKKHKHDLSYNTLIRLSTHIPVRYQALIFDEFPDRVGAPPLGKPVTFIYESLGAESSPTTDDQNES